jgi:hypothetical protein
MTSLPEALWLTMLSQSGEALMRWMVAAGVMALAVACGPVTAQPAAPPAWVTGSVCRPTFTVPQGRFSAGTGFLFRTGRGEEVVLATSQHLFGPGGGLEAEIPWDRMSETVQGADCDAFEGDRTWRTGPPLEITDAAQMTLDAPTKRDIALFPVDPAGARAFTLAPDAPAPGERVWLVAQLIKGAPPDQLLHPATVIDEQRGLLWIRYDNPNLVITATSGGPIVNARGELVAVNFGGGRGTDGSMLGIALQVPLVRDAVAAIRK